MTRPVPGLDPAHVARFATDVVRTLGHALAEDAPLGIAVSGGPDSMALLALAAAAYPRMIRAATVDHGLRPAAAEEAALVARWCAAANVPHETLTMRGEIGPTAIQATARTLRYARLGRWVAEIGAVGLATAHHVDDQAETFLMRAVRGSGTAGLAGVRARRIHSYTDGLPEFTVIRPVLGWRRAELRAIVQAAGIPFVDDPSNVDSRFERVRVRELLAEIPWLDAVGLARSAQYAEEAHAALEATARTLWSDRIAVDEGDMLTARLADLPDALQRLLVRDAILAVRRSERITRPEFDLSSNVEPLLESLRIGVSATQGGVMVSEHSRIWRFRPEPPRRSA